jgi:penicillin-binding protein 1A
MFRRFVWILLSVLVLVSVAGAAFLVWGYHYITRDLPQLATVHDYRPDAVSQLFSDDGVLLGEFFEQRRYPIKLKDVPVMVRNCFLAAEDASFYSHPGIDPMSILRAVVKNVQTGASSQGGSTITQQVVKNLLLTPEKKIQRKIKEAILSYQLEKSLSKDDILEIYLNQIFFGNTAYGLRAATLIYFHKEPAQLTLGEAAMLAALPKAPSRYSPTSNLARAKRRQRYVLDQMVKAGFTTEDAAKAAADEEFPIYPATSNNIFKAPYYVAEVRRILNEDPRFKDLRIDTDGLRIETALNLTADVSAAKALRKGLRDVDKRRGWRGPLAYLPPNERGGFAQKYKTSIRELSDTDQTSLALVLEVQANSGIARVDLGSEIALIELKKETWAKRRLGPVDQVSWIQPEQVLKPGDVIEVSLATESGKKSEKESLRRVVLDQTPEVEGAAVVLDPLTGKVVALSGGYSYQRSVFNRATQSLRQPGSTFKPVIYLAAIDGFQYTPSTIVYDQPRAFRVGDEFWEPGNFDEKFMGPITLRTALEKSRNLVSADIISRIGIDAAIQYARKLGITSKLGKNLSLSLGSSEVTLMELARAYGVFPARGLLADSVFITRIVDRTGAEIYNSDKEQFKTTHQVIGEQSAFIMANLMKGVVEHGTGTKVKELGRPAAGKTGTSNDQMDAWFIGFTPSWVGGVWVGFDVKKEIGDKETGGKVAAPIFVDIMKGFLQHQDELYLEKMRQEARAESVRLGIPYTEPELPAPLDFSVPEGVDPFWVNKESGLLASEGETGAILEYFIKGTEPSRTGTEQEDTSSYLESPDL